jgi:hypothetical protein
MGTSRSSPGAPPGVPMVPPWTPPPLPPEPTDQKAELPSSDPAAPDKPVSAPAPLSSPIAPAGRFGGARTNLGRFAKSGARKDLQRGLGHYVHKGLGGSQTATRRAGSVARTAGVLHGALSAMAAGQRAQTTVPLDPAILRGRSVDEIVSAVVEAVRPTDGTLDGDADRNAIKDALSQLLEQFPDADMLNLDNAQRELVVERFVAVDIFNRLCLDVWKAVQDKAPSPSAALSRLRTIKDYIRETVASTFRRIRAASETLTARRVSAIVRQTIQETYQIFEDFI